MKELEKHDGWSSLYMHYSICIISSCHNKVKFISLLWVVIMGVAYDWGSYFCVKKNNALKESPQTKCWTIWLASFGNQLMFCWRRENNNYWRTCCFDCQFWAAPSNGSTRSEKKYWTYWNTPCSLPFYVGTNPPNLYSLFRTEVIH